MDTHELFELNKRFEISPGLTEAIQSFPTVVFSQHCGADFEVSPFDIYAICPVCGVKFKLRSFSAGTELQDLFDAVFEWMLKPNAQAAFQRRQKEIIEDS